MARANATQGEVADVSPVPPEEMAEEAPVVEVPAAPLPVPQPEPSHDIAIALDGYALSEATLVRSKMWTYLTMIVNVIERCQLTQGELVAWLRACIRQRSFDTLSRREYVLKCLWERPPPEL